MTSKDIYISFILQFSEAQFWVKRSRIFGVIKDLALRSYALLTLKDICISFILQLAAMINMFAIQLKITVMALS